MVRGCKSYGHGRCHGNDGAVILGGVHEVVSSANGSIESGTLSWHWLV
jgi:hypothetical protein